MKYTIWDLNYYSDEALIKKVEEYKKNFRGNKIQRYKKVF
jgi:hypothetical protein